MMRAAVGKFALALILCCNSIALAAGVAVGDSPPLKGRAVDGSAVDLAALRGKLVLVDFWSGRDQPNRNDQRKLIDLFKEFHPKGLEIVGVCCERHLSDVQRWISELGITWPQVHEPADWRGGIGAAWGVPRVNWDFLLAPDGKVIYVGEPQRLREQIESALKEHPPQLVDPAVLARAKEDLDAVEKLLTDKDREGAIRRFTAAPEEAGKDPDFAARAATVRTKINDAADQLLAEVDPLLSSGKYQEAAARVRQLLSVMAGLPTASLARQRLAEMVSNPDVQRELKKKEHEEAGDVALGEARRLRDAGEAEEAYEKFQSVARDFAGTPAASAAADAVKTYDADPAFQRRMKDRAAAPKAKAALNLAENYRSAGMPDKAKEKYREVITQFPGTSYAETAQRELNQLR
jgi:tetratricopeptide (TPR) repeat protein